MSFSFSFEPSRELKRKLKQLTDDAIREAVAHKINESLDKAVELVKGSTPEGESGELRKSIQVMKYASPGDLSGTMGSLDPKAVHVEYGTGMYSEKEGSNKQPFVVKAKNWRKVYRINKNGKLVKYNVKLLTFYSHFLGHWISKKQVTIKGQKPQAMFRNNIHKIRRRFGAAIRSVLEDV